MRSIVRFMWVWPTSRINGTIFLYRAIVIARTIYQSVTITWPNRYFINLRVPKCVIARERRHFSTRPIYGVIRLRVIYFEGVRLVHTTLSAIRRKIAENRVPFMSDRFASTFYTCVIYISPKLSWHDGAHRSARHDYLMDCVRIRLNTQWLNSYELWANVCVSAHVVKASIKKTKRFYKSCESFLLFFPFKFLYFPWFTTECRGNNL